MSEAIGIVGLGGVSKRECYEYLRDKNYSICLICGQNEIVPDGLFSSIIKIDTFHNHQKDVFTANLVLEELSDRKISLSGILTLWEDCVPLSSKLAELLNLPTNGYVTGATVKNKFKTQRSLYSSPAKCVRELASKVCLPKSEKEIENWFSNTEAPSLMKLTHGSSAAGVFKVDSAQQAISEIESLKRDYRTEFDLPGIGLGFGSEIMLTELHSGSEHDVDIVIHDGELIAGFVSDNGETGAKYFAEITAVMPSQLSPSMSELLIQSASSAAYHLGLHTGVFNFEFIIVDTQPKLIDVNARMGGFYIRNWIKRIWNYDILDAAIECAMGGEPIHLQNKPTATIVGAMLLPSAFANTLSQTRVNDIVTRANINPNVIVSIFETSFHIDRIVDEPWANIGCITDSYSKSKKGLANFLDSFGLLEIDSDLKTSLSSLRGRHDEKI